MHRAESYVVSVDSAQGRLAGALVSHFCPRFPEQDLVPRLKMMVSGQTAGWLTCSEGPVLTERAGEENLSGLLKGIDELASQLGVSMVQIHGALGTSEILKTNQMMTVFSKHGYVHKSWLTAVVDLTISEESMLSSFDHAARKAISKCQNAGIIVHQCVDLQEYLELFIAPYYASLHNEKRSGQQPTNTAEVWKIDEGHHYRYFVARDAKGTVLGTLGSYSFNGVATEIMSAITPEGRMSRLPVQDLLHWEAFRVQRAVGDTLFNLAGYSPDPATPKEAGIRRFKEKWNGREVQLAQFTRQSGRLAAVVHSLSGVIRNNQC